MDLLLFKLDKVIKVVRPNDIVLCIIMQHKEDGKWSFVNLTKDHICTCKFDTYEDALNDLNEQVKNGSVLRYSFINKTIKMKI